MQSKNEQYWATNYTNKEYFDGSMERNNIGQWLALIEQIQEQELTDKVVLDFGCNRGLFLRVLYSEMPFAHGYGVDLDSETIRIAKERQGDLPLTYEVKDNLKHLEGTINMAFSHEVLYLIKDISQHAKEMFNALKEDGVYYVALGTHSDNPIWEKLKEAFCKKLGIEPQDYTLYQIAEVFERQGFMVQARKFKFDDFLPMEYLMEDRADLSMIEMLDYYSYKILFRFTK